MGEKMRLISRLRPREGVDFGRRLVSYSFME